MSDALKKYKQIVDRGYDEKFKIFEDTLDPWCLNRSTLLWATTTAATVSSAMILQIAKLTTAHGRYSL